MTGQVLSLAPLRHRRVLADGSETTARITEGYTAYQCDGRSGFGMSEFLDLIVDGRPITVTMAA